jgi:hypothetical protein
VAGGWRRLHNEEIHRILMGWSTQGERDGPGMNTRGEMKSAYKILVGKPDGKRALGRGKIILERISGK